MSKFIVSLNDKLQVHNKFNHLHPVFTVTKYLRETFLTKKTRRWRDLLKHFQSDRMNESNTFQTKNARIK